MMISLSVINFDRTIFKLMKSGEFDIHQMEYCIEFFNGLKATLFACLFDLDQMGSDLPLIKLSNYFDK